MPIGPFGSRGLPHSDWFWVVTGALVFFLPGTIRERVVFAMLAVAMGIVFAGYELLIKTGHALRRSPRPDGLE